MGPSRSSLIDSARACRGVRKISGVVCWSSLWSIDAEGYIIYIYNRVHTVIKFQHIPGWIELNFQDISDEVHHTSAAINLYFVVFGDAFGSYLNKINVSF